MKMRNEHLRKTFINIQRSAPITRKALARSTGQSVATISNHANILIDQDLVYEEDKGKSTGGRRPVFLNINSQKKAIFTVDIRVEGIAALNLYDLSLQQISEKNIKIEPDSSERTLHKISQVIEPLLNDNDFSIEKLLGIGVSVPGIVDRKNERLIFAPNLKWSGANITEYLQKTIKTSVFVENDANCAVVGEHIEAFSEKDNLIYVLIKEGIGGGIIIQNTLYRGSDGNAGDFGHMMMDSSSAAKTCYCGDKGCWETIASERYLLEECRKALDNQSLTKAQLYELGRKNQKINSVISETGYNIGVGLASIISAYNPGLIVIGGGIVEVRNIIQSEIKSALNKRITDTILEELEIRFSRLADSGISIGLAHLVFEKYFEI